MLRSFNSFHIYFKYLQFLCNASLDNIFNVIFNHLFYVWKIVLYILLVLVITIKVSPAKVLILLLNEKISRKSNYFFENKWLYKKYIGQYPNTERILTREFILDSYRFVSINILFIIYGAFYVIVRSFKQPFIGVLISFDT